MPRFEPRFTPLAIGSVPHEDPLEACKLVLEYFREIPCWPQLPKRSFLENMYVQFSENFPGLVLGDEQIYVDLEKHIVEAEKLYSAVLDNNLGYGRISGSYASGLPIFRDLLLGGGDKPVAVKGQVTGPISWGLSVTDQDKQPLVYDDNLADAVAKHLRLKAAWQEKELISIHPKTIIFIDEPYMSLFGSAFFPVGREKVVALLEEVLTGLSGLKGVHCCGNTDWPLLLGLPIDILSFDAYQYGESLTLYPREVGEFLGGGGAIAWGIVPANRRVGEENVERLVKKLLLLFDKLASKGVPMDDIVSASLVTPSCGTGGLSKFEAQKVFRLTVGVAKAMQNLF